ncbi:MAG: hypothetical protein AAGK32_17640 [Actinomycetota bacterium]
MFKRLFWLTVGMALGAYVAVRVVRTARQYRPDTMAADAQESIRRLGADLRTAFKEGRAEMIDAEASIRARLAEPPNSQAKPPGQQAKPPGQQGVTDPSQ